MEFELKDNKDESWKRPADCLELGQFVHCLNVYSVRWTVCIYTLCLLLSQQTPTPTTLTADLQKMMKMMSAVKSNVWACRHQFYYQVSCCHGDQPGLWERERESQSLWLLLRWICFLHLSRQNTRSLTTHTHTHRVVVVIPCLNWTYP